MRAFDLSQYAITVRNIFRNASSAKLYEEAIRHEPGTSISSTDPRAALAALLDCRSARDLNYENLGGGDALLGIVRGSEQPEMGRMKPK